MRLNWLVLYLLVFLSFGIALNVWQSGRASTIQQDETRQQFITQLAAAITAKPASTDELLTAATELCQCVQIRWQRRDGNVEFVAGSVTIPQAVMADGWSQQQELPVFTVNINNDSQLVAVFPAAAWSINWLQFSLCFIGIAVTVLSFGLFRYQRDHQRQLAEQLSRLAGNENWKAQDFAGQMQLLHVIEVELLQRRQHEQELMLQVDDAKQQLHLQQTNAIQQIERQQRQLNALESENHSWQLLAKHCQQLPSAQLLPLCSAFVYATGGSIEDSACAGYSFADWYQQQFELATAIFGTGNQLLPDEDPAICRTQVEVDYHQLAGVCHLLLELIREHNSGPETLFGYRLLDEVRPYLYLTVQYNGGVLPGKIKQILKQGPIPSPTWPELLAGMIYQLLQKLAGALDLQELTDVGCRFTLKIPVRLVAKSEKKLCQNLLVYDNRECRQGLWRYALQGVAEQVLMVSAFTQLWHTAKHRLIDMVVVHLRDETVSSQELEQLKTLAQRYPMMVFLSGPQGQVCSELAGIAKIQHTPVLLGAMCEHQMVDTLLAQQQLLVVDDNQTNLSFIRAMLTGMGLGIDFATSGYEAIQLAERTKYQLILMDIQLPDISGMDVTKRIRQIRHHQHTQVLAFTAHALPEEVASFKLAGMDDVLFKPLDERKIAHILQRLSKVRETL